MWLLLTETPAEIPPHCPTCRPDLDPESFVVAFCGEHRPDISGTADALVEPRHLRAHPQGSAVTTPAADLREFFLSVTIESPKWTARAEALVNRGDQGMIKLLAGYLPVLPPSLRAAVLQVMSVKTVKPHREAVLAAKSARTLKTQHKSV